MYLCYRLTSEDNSTIAGLDYTPLFANNAIVISPSDGTEKLIPVTIRNDEQFEEEENFRLRLSTTDPSVRVTTPDLANVFITDDDGKTMHIYNYVSNVNR